MLNDDDVREFISDAGSAFEKLSANQLALARGIEQLGDSISCLTLAIMHHGYITEETYAAAYEQVRRRRKELRNEPDCDILAKLFRATKPSEN